MVKLEDYKEFAEPRALDRIRKLAAKLQGKKILMVSSTNQAGGVAELLNSLVPLLNDLGVKTEWKLLTGDGSFFTITKRIHNFLQGEKGRLTSEEKQAYLETNRVFAGNTNFSPYDLVVVHDPQPLPLINFVKHSCPWILELHLDLTAPEPAVLEFISKFTRKYDELVLSHEDFVKTSLGAAQRVFPPAIDPLSEKNQDLSPAAILASLRKRRVSVAKPIIAQVSRFDKWKDPLGVIKIFELIRAGMDCELVLLGSFASDDPEGQAVYDQVRDAASKSQYRDDIKIILVHDPIFTNALQRAARVVIQKSIREGFGLIVSEALFKQTPVVASNTGGIKLQVVGGRNGYLHDPDDLRGFARDTVKILKDDDLRSRLGQNGRRRVTSNFLMPRLLLDWLNLFNRHLIKYGRK